MTRPADFSLQISKSNRALIVRFQRKQWSALLNREYDMTDLIFSIRPEHEEALRADFDVYRHLDLVARRTWIRRLTAYRYVGRQLLPETGLCDVATTKRGFQPNLCF